MAQGQEEGWYRVGGNCLNKTHEVWAKNRYHAAVIAGQIESRERNQRIFINPDSPGISIVKISTPTTHSSPKNSDPQRAYGKNGPYWNEGEK